MNGHTLPLVDAVVGGSFGRAAYGCRCWRWSVTAGRRRSPGRWRSWRARLALTLSDARRLIGQVAESSAGMLTFSTREERD
jgi:hypothetical protein